MTVWARTVPLRKASPNTRTRAAERCFRVIFWPLLSSFSIASNSALSGATGKNGLGALLKDASASSFSVSDLIQISKGNRHEIGG